MSENPSPPTPAPPIPVPPPEPLPPNPSPAPLLRDYDAYYFGDATITTSASHFRHESASSYLPSGNKKRSAGSTLTDQAASLCSPWSASMY